MTFFITLGLVDIIEDSTVELIKKELARATSIRRAIRQGPNVEVLHDQPATTNPGASYGGVASRVVEFGGDHNDTDIDASRDDEHVDAKEKIYMFEITPYTGLSHSYTDPFLPYGGPSHLSSPSCSHCKCKECKDR
ncbi:hypothetical protein FXO38_36160 [Capsicum annuum]|nr:hypothetical protein FXO38_36160 [Capsicum annuum]KAF3613619.1 hypothetical protein FXO37_36305 [Capsicum annuum]